MLFEPSIKFVDFFSRLLFCREIFDESSIGEVITTFMVLPYTPFTAKGRIVELAILVFHISVSEVLEVHHAITDCTILLCAVKFQR